MSLNHKNRHRLSSRFLVWALTSTALLIGALNLYMMKENVGESNRIKSEYIEEKNMISKEMDLLRRSLSGCKKNINDHLWKEITSSEFLWKPSLTKFAEKDFFLKDNEIYQPLEEPVKEILAIQSSSKKWTRKKLNHKRLLSDFEVSSDFAWMKLRDTIAEIEGKKKLNEVLQYRKYKQASGQKANELAHKILKRKNNSNVSLIHIETSNLALYRKDMLSAENTSVLADIKDNKIKPLVHRLKNLFDPFSDDKESMDQLNHEFESFLVELFGQNYSIDELQQSIMPGDGGLFQTCQHSIKIEEERNHLKNQANNIERSLDRAFAETNHLVDTMNEKLGVRLAQSSRSTQRRLITVLILSSIFILLLSWVIATSISNQIKEINETNKKLDEVISQANKANQTKSQFLSSMSHEIRTPLNGILGAIRFLNKTNLTPSQNKWSKIINESSNLLIKIINDILDFSKLHANKIELESIDFNFIELIHNTTDMFQGFSENQQGEIKLSIDESIHENFIGDPYRLRQILNNLISNAVKFSNGEVVEVNIKVLQDDDGVQQLKIAVTDKGIGIPQDRLNRLFKAFSQIDQSHNRQYGGTGLGLIISKNIVELMNGSIHVDSEVGKGSTFWIEIPLIKQTDAIDLESSTSQSQKSELPQETVEFADGIEILLVEDNEVNALIVKQMLEDLNLKCDLATNGFIAVKKVKKKKYDLVLMDVQMPVLNGIQATKEIRKTENKDERLPVIALTANVLDLDKKLCFAAGMDDYINKPIHFSELQKKLTTWLSSRKISKNENTNEREGHTAKKEMTNLHCIHIDKALEIVQGNIGIVHKVVDAFVAEQPKYLSRLNEAIKQKNLKATQTEAHTVKSAAAYIGALTLNQLSKDIEHAARQGDMPTCEKLFNDFKLEIENLVQEISQIEWDNIKV